MNSTKSNTFIMKIIVVTSLLTLLLLPEVAFSQSQNRWRGDRKNTSVNHFIETTNNQGLNSRTRNQNRMRILPNGIGLSIAPKLSKSSNLMEGSENLYSGLFTQNIGLGMRFSLHKNDKIFLLINTGYQKNGFMIKNSPNTTNVVDDQGNITNDITYLDLVNVNNSVYLSALVGVNFFEFSNGYSIYGAIGKQVQYMYSNKITQHAISTNTKSEIYTTSDISQPFSASFTTEIGMFKQIGSFSVSIAPFFSCDFNAAIVNNSPIHREHKYYNLGINFRLFYNL